MEKNGKIENWKRAIWFWQQNKTNLTENISRFFVVNFLDKSDLKKQQQQQLNIEKIN